MKSAGRLLPDGTAEALCGRCLSGIDEVFKSPVTLMCVVALICNKLDAKLLLMRGPATTVVLRS